MNNVLQIDKRPTVIDLFAGAGGMSLGALRAGFDLALAVELDPHAVKTHKQNFPRCQVLKQDITNLSGTEILEQSNLSNIRLDGLIGGPPCQGFSTMGKRNANDPRNNLFVRFFQLVAECQPKFFVAENVPGILHKQYDEVRQVAIQHVRNNYVLLEPIKIRASDFGTPTSRERVFFIGYLRNMEIKSLTQEDFLPNPPYSKTTVEDALFGLPQINNEWVTEAESWRTVEPPPESEFFQGITSRIPLNVGDKQALEKYKSNNLVSGCFGTRHSEAVIKRYDRLKPGEQDSVSKSVRLRLGGFCPTLRAGTGSDRGSFQAVRPIHPTEPRVITPREAARLQGFPDWFQFSSSKWQSFRQIGNSVSPIVAEVVLKTILERL